MHELIRHPDEAVYINSSNKIYVGAADNSSSVKIRSQYSNHAPIDMVLSNQDVDDFVVMLRYYQKEVFGAKAVD